jgi:hypothetical protein
MIETHAEFENWLQDIRSLTESDHIFLHIVQSNDDDHPVVAKPIVLFARVVKSQKSFVFSIDHQDSTCPVPLSMVCASLDSLKATKWVLDRKSFIETLPSLKSVNDINLLLFTETNKTIETFEHQTTAHSLIKRTVSSPQVNRIIPLMKHLEMFDELYECVSRAITKHYNKSDTQTFNLFNFKILDILSELESNGLCVDPIKFNEHFKSKVYEGNLVYTQYNLYTAAGRPSNRFGGVNYAALNKDDGTRSCFVSRFKNEGRLFLVDYSAFHPRLICYMVGYEIPSNVDIYRYLGELYFNRKNLSEFDIDEAKTITFRQLYGGVQDRYKHIKYFVHLKDFIAKNWDNFQKDEYVLTPWFKRKIDNKHLKDANPNKLFNYILQASELESVSQTISILNEYLRDKKSKTVLYTYDSLLFDIHGSEVKYIIPKIVDIMSHSGKVPVKSYLGDNYNELRQVII